ncbi:MAG: homocysteine S-methyltransferase family protein, partial [Parasporobacterium sp.]|nr:homocysteine S-methyltransferase family protein [Parasporobacterium sp.]
MLDLLKDFGKRIIFLDGGMGSELQKRGLTPGEKPELWNLTHSKEILEIHKEYLAAGADIISTNTFGANGLKYDREGEMSLEKVIEAAVSLAKEAVNVSGKKAAVALDIGPSGKLLKPYGDLSFDEAVALFSEICRIGEKCGADFVLIETMSDTYEMKAAVIAAKEITSLPVFASMTYGADQRLLTGASPEEVAALLEGLGVDAIGVNCGLGPAEMRKVAQSLMQFSSIPVFVVPNAGLPRVEDGRTVYDVSPTDFASEMVKIAKEGAWALGGCCGTTPEHIRETVKLCREIVPVMIRQKHRTVASSFCRTVVFDRKPVIIGERINPTGKKKLKEALKCHDMEYILQEGLKQEENGADILDVNVGVPGIDEAATMLEAVMGLQSVTGLPLQIDTADLKAMETALRHYNGKAVVNSVNGKMESMESVFPLVKKYGGVVVALLLDEDGIPKTADGRIEIAKKIYRKAEEYGIRREDILIDALCLTISSEPEAAMVTLETVRRVRDELGGKTILGVSNISFGLPQRENINSAFFTMAMQNGLSAGIINPGSEAMMKAWRVYCAIANLDPQCMEYIECYANAEADAGPGSGKTKKSPAGPGPVKPSVSEKNRKIDDYTSGNRENTPGEALLGLEESIKKGLKEKAGSITADLLNSFEPLDLINKALIPALDEVGKGFEKGKLFLPQLLMSAEAAKSAFQSIKEFIAETGVKQEEKGKIVLATVKGDIHDIGK